MFVFLAYLVTKVQKKDIKQVFLPYYLEFFCN